MLPLEPKPETRQSTRLGLIASLALAASLAAAPSVSAASVQFAQFNQTAANQPFSFTNNATSGTLAYNSNTQVTFNFTAETGLGTFDRTATVSLTGPSTATPATGGTFVDQPISDALTLTITEVGGANPGANLLTMIFTGDLTGRTNGPTGSIAGAETSGQTVLFSSDFLTFDTPANSYQLGLDTITPVLSLGAGGYLSSFVSNIQGQFSSSVIASVPAPASVVMFGTGLAATAALARRARRRTRFAGVAP